eukprot:354668-Pyramimonas_sp.AAC.2
MEVQLFGAHMQGTHTTPTTHKKHAQHRTHITHTHTTLRILGPPGASSGIQVGPPEASWGAVGHASQGVATPLALECDFAVAVHSCCKRPFSFFV